MKGTQHSINLMLQHKQERIKELELEVARLKIGGQPASKVRDLVLTALKLIKGDLSINAIESAQKALDRTIMALGEAIPGDVARKPAPKEHESGVKPYKSLDHGPRDNDAAAAQYRTEPR
jgi:hypothetical protein